MEFVSSASVVLGMFLTGIAALAYGCHYLMQYALERDLIEQEAAPEKHSQSRRRKKKEVDTPTALKSQPAVGTSSPEVTQTPAAPRISRNTEKKAIQTWTGRVISTSRHQKADEHGSGKFQQFYAVIENAQGTVEVSGNALEAELDRANVRIGDRVLLKHVGMEDVVVYSGGKPTTRKRKQFAVIKI
jgi:hypothetical protein